MLNMQQFKEAFFSLSIEQKEAVFHELEWDLRKDLHERALQENLAVAEKRLADLDAGITKPVPWDEAMARIFPKT